MNGTHTYVTMPVQPGTFAEVKEKLVTAGYDQLVQMTDGTEVLDMRGIALAVDDSPNNPVTALEKYLKDCGFQLIGSDMATLQRMREFCDGLV